MEAGDHLKCSCCGIGLRGNHASVSRYQFILIIRQMGLKRSVHTFTQLAKIIRKGRLVT
jgi:hypothetical protein